METTVVYFIYIQPGGIPAVAVVGFWSMKLIFLYLISYSDKNISFILYWLRILTRSERRKSEHCNGAAY